MFWRIGFGVAVAALAILVFRQPAPRAAIEAVSTAAPSAAGTAFDAEGAPARAGRHRRRGYGSSASGPLVVYVVGAVRHSGLFTLGAGDRYARAVSLAGGMTAAADPAGVDLAQRAQDGDEIEVPAVGERAYGRASRSSPRSTRRRHQHAATPPPDASIDVNAADAGELAAVPGIGRAIASRIVELRSQQGNFASLDELLDVAGMTQSRLDRARPYLRDP